MFNEIPDFESDIVEISEKLNDGLFDEDKIWTFMDSDFEEFNFNEYYLDDNYKEISNYIIDKLSKLNINNQNILKDLQIKDGNYE